MLVPRKKKRAPAPAATPGVGGAAGSAVTSHLSFARKRGELTRQLYLEWNRCVEVVGKAWDGGVKAALALLCWGLPQSPRLSTCQCRASALMFGGYNNRKSLPLHMPTSCLAHHICLQVCLRRPPPFGPSLGVESPPSVDSRTGLDVALIPK